jgi:CubicO group peptidase (beta-lactamase class C family)
LLGYFPEYTDLQVPERRRITIRHAVGMSAGLEWNEDLSYADPKNDENVMDASPDPVRYVLGRPIVAAPGATCRYNGGTH